MYEAFIELSIEATRYYERSGGGQARPYIRPCCVFESLTTHFPRSEVVPFHRSPNIVRRCLVQGATTNFRNEAAL